MRMSIPKEKKTKSETTTAKPKRIKQAVSILRQLNQKHFDECKKKPLFEDSNDSPIILQVMLKKIPHETMQKHIKILLPNIPKNPSSEVCLITGDLDKRNTKAETEPDVLHFKELLQKSMVSEVNEVITLRQLRKEYKPFEAKRQLCGAYDIFLCDKRIANVLPSFLGKTFFKKRKLPIQINMQTKNLKQQIVNAISSTVFSINCKGNSCASIVANLAMNDEDIVSNVCSAIEVLTAQLPGKLENVLSIYLKTAKSKAIPLYMSLDNPNELKLNGKRKRIATAEKEELSTLSNAFVTVFKDGSVVVKKVKAEKQAPKSAVKGEKEVEAEEPAAAAAAAELELKIENSPVKKTKSKREKKVESEEPAAAELELKVESSPVKKTRGSSKKKRKLH